MTIIDELSSAARTVADAVGPATVSIGRAGRGTGFVVAPGKVLTNAHNLRDHTTSVTFADGRTEQAAVAGVDPDGDLVVLDVDTADVAALAWGEAAPAADVIFAVGRGGHRFRVSLGLVSGTERAFRGPRGRRINGSIEHTAALARGSSGGPVVDQQGRVVGVNTSDEEENAVAWIKARGVTFPIARDSTNGIARAFHVDSLPTLVLLTKDGKVHAVRAGVTRRAELEELIREIL